MSRPRRPGSVLAALVRASALACAVVLVLVIAAPGDTVPPADPGPVVAELAPDEPLAAGPSPVITSPAPALVRVRPRAHAPSWSSRAAPPPSVPPPKP